MMVPPAVHKLEKLTTSEDKLKYRKRPGFDERTKNPGQIGKPIKIEEHRTQIVPALKQEVSYGKPWRVEKKKKPKQKVKVDKAKARLDQNMLTVELTQE